MVEKSRSKHILRTTDLLLASFLYLKGYEPDLSAADGDEVREGHPQGAWEFEGDGADLWATEFEKGQAKVEPRQFYATVKRMRREMFKFLGIGS